VPCTAFRMEDQDHKPALQGPSSCAMSARRAFLYKVKTNKIYAGPYVCENTSVPKERCVLPTAAAAQEAGLPAMPSCRPENRGRIWATGAVRSNNCPVCVSLSSSSARWMRRVEGTGRPGSVWESDSTSYFARTWAHRHCRGRKTRTDITRITNCTRDGCRDGDRIRGRSRQHSPFPTETFQALYGRPERWCERLGGAVHTGADRGEFSLSDCSLNAVRLAGYDGVSAKRGRFRRGAFECRSYAGTFSILLKG